MDRRRPIQHEDDGRESIYYADNDPRGTHDSRTNVCNDFGLGDRVSINTDDVTCDNAQIVKIVEVCMRASSLPLRAGRALTVRAP